MSKKFTPDRQLLESIARICPTPFHLYSEAEIRMRARQLKNAFSWNKGYKEYYAVKACPTPGVIDILKQEGCGVDCASLTELMLAKAMGFRGEDIMFSSNETPYGEFAFARQIGAIINLDDITLIDSLDSECKMPEMICLRYNPGGEFRIGNAIMGNPQEAKYGMTRSQIFDAVRKCKALGVKRFALHAFLASNQIDSQYYPERLGLPIIQSRTKWTSLLWAKRYSKNMSK